MSYSSACLDLLSGSSGTFPCFSDILSTQLELPIQQFLLKQLPNQVQWQLYNMMVILGIHNNQGTMEFELYITSPVNVKPDVETFSLVDLGVLLLDGDSVVTSETCQDVSEISPVCINMLLWILCRSDFAVTIGSIVDPMKWTSVEPDRENSYFWLLKNNNCLYMQELYHLSGWLKFAYFYIW